MGKIKMLLSAICLLSISTQAMDVPPADKSACVVDDHDRLLNSERQNDYHNLFLLAQFDYGQQVVWFLSKVPDVDVNFIYCNKSLLDWSVINEDEVTAKYLVSRGARLYRLTEDHFYETFPNVFSSHLLNQKTPPDFDLAACRRKNSLYCDSRSVILKFPKSPCVFRLALWVAVDRNNFQIDDVMYNKTFFALVRKKINSNKWVGKTVQEIEDEVYGLVKESRFFK